MEIFKDITEYEGKYQISNLGRVRSIGRKEWNGNSFWKSEDRFLTPFKSIKGYWSVGLSVKSKQKQVRVHRLIAQAFIPNPNNYPQINHINGIKTDNRIENLEWCNNSQNSQHAYDLGLRGSGEKHYKAKITEKIVKDIHNQFATGYYTKTELGKKYSISRPHVSQILSGKYWKHLVN